MSRWVSTFALFALGVGVGCQNQQSAQQQESRAADAPTLQAAETTTCSGGLAQPSAYEELASLDGRTPVPLIPRMAWHQKRNMMDHLSTVQQILDAAAQENWSAVVEAVQVIGPSQGNRQTCKHMGAGSAGFATMALAFHDSAKKIEEAARAQDSQAVLTGLSQTLQICVACHAQYKQQVMTSAEWEQVTGMTPPGPGFRGAQP